MTVEAVAAELALQAISFGLATAVKRVTGLISGQLMRFGTSHPVGVIDPAIVLEGTSLLSLLADLPHDVSLRDVQLALTSLQSQQIVREMLLVRISSQSDARWPKLRADLATQVQRQLGGTMVSDFAERASRLVADSIESKADAIAAAIAESQNPELLQTILSNELIACTLQSIDQAVRNRNLFLDADQYNELVEWERDYRMLVYEDHGMLEPPDTDTKRRIPIGDLYVSARVSPITQDPETDSVPDLDINGLLASVQRTVLLGDPGAGKSTAARYISQALAKEPHSRLPFTVTLREYAAGGDLDKSIVEFIETNCRTLYSCPPPDQAIHHLLSSGRVLVIFDGLDELLEPALRREVTRRVELFLKKYPAADALVTSRKVGYEQARLDPNIFATFVLNGLTQEDVETYVTKWFRIVAGLNEDDLRRDVAAFLVESQDLSELTRNPLMLALICIIYRGQGYIPRNRTDVYEQCAKLLFERWDTSRRIYVELTVRTQVDPAVKHLAYWMLTNNMETVTETALIREASDYLSQTFARADEREAAARQFVDFCTGRAWVFSDAGTTGDGEPLYRFTHRTFLEFFAAYEITRANDTPEDVARALLPRVAEEEWEVVAQLAVQLTNKHRASGGDRVIAKLLQLASRRRLIVRERVYSFCWNCLHMLMVSPSTRLELVRRSVESSLAYIAEPRNDEERDSRGSILGSTHVLAEARGEVAQLVFDQLQLHVDTNDQYGPIARNMLLAWPVHSSSVPSGEFEPWHELSMNHFNSMRSSLLPLDASSSAWRVALIRRRVSMTEFIDRHGGRSEEAYPELFFSTNIDQPQINFGSWASWMLNWFMPDDSPWQGDALLSCHISNLESLGAAIERPPATSIDSSHLGFLHAVSFSRRADVDLSEDAQWALFLCAAPFFEHYHRWERRRAEQSASNGGGQSSRRAAANELNLANQFTFGRPERLEFMNAWLDDALSLAVFERAPRPPAVRARTVRPNRRRSSDD